MVHGQGGKADHWVDPGKMGHNYDYEGTGPKSKSHGWHVGPPLPMTLPNVPPVLDKKKKVTGIQPYLKQRRFSTVIYTQHQSDQVSIHQSALELNALILELVKQTGGVSGPRKIALLGHSRGGIVIRSFLKDHGGGTWARRLSSVITLISPHQGSQLANLSVTLGQPIEVLIAGFAVVPALQTVIRNAFKPIASSLANDSRRDLQIGSEFLRRLAHNEGPIHNVRYVTFGGTSVTLTRIWQYIYTPKSYVPQRVNIKSFNHTSFAVQWPLVSPFAELILAPCDEVRHGHGDGLVSNVRSQLPFAMHRTMHVHHGEILWDDRTKYEIANLLT